MFAHLEQSNTTAISIGPDLVIVPSLGTPTTAYVPSISTACPNLSPDFGYSATSLLCSNQVVPFLSKT